MYIVPALQEFDLNATIAVVRNLSIANSDFPYQIGTKVYHIETETRANWYRASDNCRKLGGHLWNIETSEEMDEILAIAPEGRYWTSANCLGRLNNWISSTTGNPMPLLRWNPNEPNNANEEEYCVEMYKTGLNDKKCKILTYYICEAKFI